MTLALVKTEDHRVVKGQITVENIRHSFRHVMDRDVFHNTALPDDGAIMVAFAHATGPITGGRERIAQRMMTVINAIAGDKGCETTAAGWYGDWDDFNGNKRFYLAFNNQAAHDLARAYRIPLAEAAEQIINDPVIRGIALAQDAECLAVWKKNPDGTRMAVKLEPGPAAIPMNSFI